MIIFCAVLLVIAGTIAFHIQKICYWGGNLFFGEISTIYNTSIAKHFYIYAVGDSKDMPQPYAHHQLSRTYFIEGNFEPALYHAREELRYYPEHVHTHYILGLTLGYMNREREAIESFSYFINLKPSSWAARNDMAWLQFRIGEIDEAMAAILPAAQSYPENPWVMNTYGVLLMNQGLFVEAEKALTQALHSSELMTDEEWGRAYPGNSPVIYKTGLEAMHASIRENLKKLQDKQELVADDK